MLSLAVDALNDLSPIATLRLPAVLLSKAPLPIAVFLRPVVFVFKESRWKDCWDRA